MTKYRVVPHLYKGIKPCYKLQYKEFLKWCDYEVAEGMPVWWTLEDVRKIENHMNSEPQIIEKLPDNVVQLGRVNYVSINGRP